MRKKIGMILMAGMMMCGQAVPVLAAQTATVAQEETFDFRQGNTVVKMHDEATGILTALGKEERYFEAQSCAFQGLDKTYTYKGFELSTYPQQGKDYVNSIYFLDGTVATSEGIKIGSTVNDMVAAYGKGYKELNGVYRYTKGKTELSFYTDSSKKITNIEYLAVTE